MVRRQTPKQAMLILIWQSSRQDLCIALRQGRYGVFYLGEQVSPFGTFAYARKLALAEYCMQGEEVFYQDPGTAFH